MDSPLVLALLLFVAGIFVVLLGIGVAIGLAAIGAMTVLVLMGIISTSALIGLQQRSLKTGMRVLVYQAHILGGIVAGAGVGLLGQWFIYGQMDVRIAVTAGALSGAVAGAGLAWVGLTVCRLGAAWITGKLQQRRGFAMAADGVPAVPKLQSSITPAPTSLP